MNSLFPQEERPAQPAFDRDQIPDEVRSNFAQLLDWFTPNIYVCWIILGLNVAAFIWMIAVAGFNPDHATIQALLRSGADYAPATVTRGEWWRVITSMFVHLGLMHIACNMYALANIGPFMERLLGNAGFLIVYLVAGIAGAICSLALNPYVVSAGASGAIFGLFGALIGFVVLRRDSIPMASLRSLLTSAATFIVFNAIFGVLHSGTDLAAHAGGLVGGFICGLVVSTPITAGFRQRRMQRAIAAAVGCLVALVGVAFTLPHPADFQAELSKLAATEKQVLATYTALLQKRPADDQDIANQLEAQVIRPWNAERQSLGTFKGLPRPQQHLVDSLLAYMDARQRAWSQMVTGLRGHNAVLVRQSFMQQVEAQNNLKAAMAAPNSQDAKMKPHVTTHFQGPTEPAGREAR